MVAGGHDGSRKHRRFRDVAPRRDDGLSGPVAILCRPSGILTRTVPGERSHGSGGLRQNAGRNAPCSLSGDMPAPMPAPMVVRANDPSIGAICSTGIHLPGTPVGHAWRLRGGTQSGRYASDGGPDDASVARPHRPILNSRRGGEPRLEPPVHWEPSWLHRVPPWRGPIAGRRASDLRIGEPFAVGWIGRRVVSLRPLSPSRSTVVTSRPT